MAAEDERATRAAQTLADAVQRLGASASADAAPFQAAFERSPDLMALVAPNGTLLRVNNSLVAFTRTTPEELIGLHIWDAPGWPTAGDTRNRLRAAIAAAARGTVIRYEADLLVGGDARTVDFSVTPIPDRDGVPTLLVAEGRDISTYKRVENALRSAEERLASIVSIAADAIVSVDAAQCITLFNRGAEAIFGYRAAEVMGQPLDILLPQERRAPHHSEVRAFATAGTTGRRMGEKRQVFGRRKSGEVFRAEASISRVEVAGEVVLTAVVRDVTDRWAAEQEKSELLAEAEKSRDVAEGARQRLAVIAEAGELLSGSIELETTARTIAALVVPRLAQFCVVDLVDEAGRVRRVCALHADPSKSDLADQLRHYPRADSARYLTQRAITTGAVDRRELGSDADLRDMADDDRHRDLLRALEPRAVVCIPLSARRRTLGAIGLIRDRTRSSFAPEDISLLEDLARRAAMAIDNARLYGDSRRALQYRERILAIVSHDLRNPLSAIAMCASALSNSAGELDHDASELIGAIRDSADWMQRLIEDLVDAASIEAGRLSLDPHPADPVIVASRAMHFFEPMAAERSLALVGDLPESLPPIAVDEHRILQVFGNLIGNAMKFTPAGGTITITADAVSDTVVFGVTDTGPGVAPESVPHVFEMFWTTGRGGGPGNGAKGSGLGLAIARGIVEAHGGQMWLEPPSVSGAAFRFALPVSRDRIDRTDTIALGAEG